jgi:two-component system sensor histidine kinase TorS
MGASLTVKSMAGAGSTFTLSAEFACGDPADLPALPLVAEVQHAAHTLRALVVEDNDINQMVIQTYLEDMGHAAKVVASAEAALVALREGRFDVVLMDVNLPGLSGTAATRKIRAIADNRIATLPIIGISAHVQEADILENLAAGMSAVLAKPLSPEALQAALRAHVAQEHALTELSQDIGDDRAAGLARVFLDGLPKSLAAMTAAARTADHLALARVAHQLKGAAGNFELIALTTSLARLETLAEQGPSDALETCLDELPGVVDLAALEINAALELMESVLSQAAQ